jgi:hypothetical protein
MSLLDMFRRKRTARVWKRWEHRGWGDAINFSTSTGWYGHTTPRVAKGDEIQTRCESGKVGRFIVISVRYPGDPFDMWFAEARLIGYIT